MNILKEKPISVFLHYAIPSVLGLLAISSAGVIDGLFVGNYVGSLGLAAINISFPLLSLLLGAAFMFAVGSSVRLGKLMGEGKADEASNIFTKSLITITSFALIICMLLSVSVDSLFSFLHVKGELKISSLEYIHVLLLFIPFLMVGIVLDYFVRVDEHPNLAFLALASSAVVNVLLDYLFIVRYEWGLLGAAYATGFSYIWVVLVLLTHFVSKKSTLWLIKPTGSWKVIIQAVQNGFSEFINESSVGITIAIFNFVMLKNFGAEGVAAYTVVSYIVWLSIMVSYGVSDSLQPVISKNYGAKQSGRITSFLKLALSSVLGMGFLSMVVVLLFPENIANLFLKEDDVMTSSIVLNFLTYLWPAFLFSGSSIVISAYLTAIHKPQPSAFIAMSRSLIFPAFYVGLLPLVFGEKGIYISIAFAEFTTLLMTLYLLKRYTPKKIFL